jgi:hypothetical protein
MSKECDEAFLKGAEAAFDFAFGLRRRSNAVCYTNGSQCALKLAVRVEVVAAAGFDMNPNPAFEKSRFVREGRRTVVV